MRFSPNTPWRFLLAAVVLMPLVVGVVPFAGTPVTLNVFVQAKLIVLYLTAGLALGSLALVNRQETIVYFGRSLIPLGAFVLAAAISVAAALEPRLALFGDLEQGVGFVVYALCALLALLTTQMVRDPSRLRQLTTLVVASGVAVGLVGLLQQLFYLDVLGIYSGQALEWVVQRGYGTIGNADTYAAFLVIPVMLSLHRLRGAEAPRDRMTWGAAFVLMVSTLVIAQTRAPLVGLIVGVIAYAIGELRAARKSAKTKQPKTPGRTSSRALAVFAAMAITLGAIATSVSGTALNTGSRFSLKSIVALGGRLPLWDNAVTIARSHLLFGIGPDSFRLGWYPVREVSDLANGTGLIITDPHSVPLLLGATMGVLGLIAALGLLGTAFLAGIRTLSADERRRGTDYSIWLYATLALSVTLLASMLTSVLLFMLLLAIGVLIAPTLDKRELPKSVATAARGAASVVAIALLVLGLLTAAAQVTATGARVDDPQLAATRAARAASLTPWDTGIRNLEHETMVQATFELVFTGDPGATDAVERAERVFETASQAEPHEYLHPYREALLLIGSGQELADEYTRRGIAAGVRGLEIYPKSLGLRTGVASGYMQLREPAQAELLLQELWEADPAYAASGITYAQALLAQDRTTEARAVIAFLRQRFPDDPTIAGLAQQLPADQ